MAADSPTKRLAAMDLLCPWRRTLPLPDATVDAGDRAMLLYLYSGFGAAPPVTAGGDYIPTWRPRRR